MTPIPVSVVTRLRSLNRGSAPCSPFRVTPELMKQSAELARAHSLVNLHTHLAETIDENRFCQQRFGMRPIEYMDSVGWLGDDVWFAHMVHPDAAEIGTLAHTHTGVCHCPSSNMILASGIAPVRQMVDAGVKVALGVDGSASNDGNHMLGEARVLRRDDIGALAPGMSADFVAFRIDDLFHAGGQSDPVASLLTCAPGRAWLSVINGRVVVEDGQLPDVDLDVLVARYNRVARGLLD